MDTTLITLSKNTLSRGNSISLSLIFGIVYAGLGSAYLGFFDPNADSLALGFIILMAFSGWLAFLILLASSWKRVGILSLPSHILITLAIGVVSSIVTWPLFVAYMTKQPVFLVIGLCILPVLLTYLAYWLALRSTKTESPISPDEH